MPNLAELTDYVPVPAEVPAGTSRVYINGSSTLPVDNTDIYDNPMGDVSGANISDAPAKMPTKSSAIVDKVLKNLFRDDDKRYQLWPEKVARSGFTAAHDALTGQINPYDVDPETGELNTSQEMIGRALDMSALAGVGGVGGTTDATLGATPFLRPALKYKDRIYKGKEGQEHQDVIPQHLYPEFQDMAMKGEDISHYNFGFVNDKGHFLNREDALKYGIDTGLIDPQAGKFGALTSTMEFIPGKAAEGQKPALKSNMTGKVYTDLDTMDLKQGLTTQLLADSSKPGMAIEGLAKTKNIDWNLIKSADENLTGEAAKAIDTWVGGTKDFMANGGMFGQWHPKALKEAIKNPEVKAQLDAVMAPIKEHLKAEHGDTIKLYRNHGDLPEGANPNRELLSFTSDKDFAENGFGAPKERKLIPEEEIKSKEAEYEKTGRVQIDKNTWLEKKTDTIYPQAGPNKDKPVEVTYTAIMRPDGMVTDTDSVRAYIKDINEWRSENNALREKKLKNVVTKEVPIDDIVYATDRFGQKEFIVHNKNKDLFADSSKEAAALDAIKEPFYSALEHNVKNISQNKMNGDAWLGTLANKPGVKPEELEWTGLKSFLEENKGKPVKSNPIHYIDIPQSLKDKAMSKGFPLFSSTHMFIPVTGDPFNASQKK